MRLKDPINKNIKEGDKIYFKNSCTLTDLEKIGIPRSMGRQILKMKYGIVSGGLYLRQTNKTNRAYLCFPDLDRERVGSNKTFSIPIQFLELNIHNHPLTDIFK